MGTICHHTISLDGFIAGPDDAMDWAFGYGEATALADETMHRIGAILAGRRWYELATERWEGVDVIYHGAYEGEVFVLTHHPPEGNADPRITFYLRCARGCRSNRPGLRRSQRRRDLRRELEPAVPSGRPAR